MATRGRKPLPTALKELEGDRGKGRRPLNKDEPTPPQDNVKCPAWLMPEAKKEWKRLAPSLISMGTLTEHDMEAFTGYCQAYARWREAEEGKAPRTEAGSMSGCRTPPDGAMLTINSITFSNSRTLPGQG